MQRNLIAGEETDRSGDLFPVENPATGETVEEALLGGAKDIEAEAENLTSLLTSENGKQHR